MADLIEIIALVSELAGFIVSILMGYLVYKKNPSYIGNRMMFVASFFISLYPGATFMYDVIRKDSVIQVGLRIATISIMLGSVFLYFSIQILVHSSSWWEKTISWLLPLLLCVILSIYLILIDFIETESIGTVVNNTIDIVPLALVILVVLITIIITLIELYNVGIRHSEGESRKNMIACSIGLIVCLTSIIFTIIANIIANQDIGTVLDAFTFIVLAIGLSIMAKSFS